MREKKRASTHVCGRELAQLLDAVAMVSPWSSTLIFPAPEHLSPQRRERQTETKRTRRDDVRPKDEVAKKTEGSRINSKR